MGYEARQISKEQNKNATIYVGRSTKVHNLLFCVHTLCMSYVPNTFLLVSSSVRSKQLCVLCTIKAKKANKNIQQTTLSSFLTIPLINYDLIHISFREIAEVQAFLRDNGDKLAQSHYFDLFWSHKHQLQIEENVKIIVY